MAQNFDAIDSNDSKGIDDDEYTSTTTTMAALSFVEVDSNDDGVISEREAEQTLVSLKEAFNVVDAISDSNVSTAEYEAARVNMLEGVDFAALDTDEDGVIGIEEA